MSAIFVDMHTHREGRTMIVAERKIICEGLHPWHCCDDADVSALERQGVEVVGEIGLDFACKVDRRCQQKLFEVQLAIAERRALPVVLHCVRAYNDVLSTLARYRLPAVVFHSFVGSVELARQIVARGYYLSLSPVSLKSPKTCAALLRIDRNRLFLESDTTGVDIADVYAEAAKILNVDPDDLKAELYDNYKRLFE